MAAFEHGIPGHEGFRRDYVFGLDMNISREVAGDRAGGAFLSHDLARTDSATALDGTGLAQTSHSIAALAQTRS